MKLITEHTQDVHFITEKTNGENKLFIEGIFMQAEIENRNHRIYRKPILEKAINLFITEQVQTGRAVGELNHPEGPQINLDKVSHRITELTWSKNDVIGKAQILKTPMGEIARGLIEGGVKLGVSSRGMGSVEKKESKIYVKDDFVLATIDIVQDPSAHKAFVDGIMEGVEWIVGKNGELEQHVDTMRKKLHKVSARNLHEAQLTAWEHFLKVLINK